MIVNKFGHKTDVTLSGDWTQLFLY